MHLLSSAERVSIYVSFKMVNDANKELLLKQSFIHICQTWMLFLKSNITNIFIMGVVRTKPFKDVASDLFDLLVRISAPQNFQFCTLVMNREKVTFFFFK